MNPLDQKVTVMTGGNQIELNVNDLWFIIGPILTVVLAVVGGVALLKIFKWYSEVYMQKKAYFKARREEREREFKELMVTSGYDKRIERVEDNIERIISLELDVHLTTHKVQLERNTTELSNVSKNVEIMQQDMRDMRNMWQEFMIGKRNERN